MSLVKGPAPAPAAAPAPGPSQEYTVRVPQGMTKKHSILKFHHSLKIDLTKSGPMRMNRENNLREFRQSYDMDAAPKFGAGSEFGREQREEARRKKYGIYRKKYNPEDQPWHMTLGEGKNTKKLKGVKEGGIADNVSYFVFTQCPDGAFEAFPIDDWYHFSPEINYKVLTSEEAEEEFSRRDQTLNHFSIMVRNKVKRKGEEDEVEEKEKKTKKSKAKEGLLLTEEDEWAVLSDGDVEENSDAETDKKPEKHKKKGKDKGKPAKRSMKRNSDDEAMEESDSFDEGDEVDYMTDSESNDEDMYKDENRDDKDNYKEQGVEDEEALKKLVESGEEDEEEEKENEDENEEEEKDKKDPNDSDSDSSDSSGSDSDPEKDGSFSVLFMQKKKDEKKKEDKKKDEKKKLDKEARSRSGTPTEDKGKKRKAETESPAPKKVKVEPTLSPSSSSSNLAIEGITEDAVRRYLLRKPMTTKDLVQKFKNTGLSKDQLVNSIAKILKRINPEKIKTKDKLYLSIRKTE